MKHSVQKPLVKHLPFAVPVHVQCNGFRCLAYRDKDGNWVEYYSGEPLEGTVTLIGYDAE